jgi:hypothetical protein
VSPEVAFRLFEAFPQIAPTFPVLCIARRSFSRFFDHDANAVGIRCVVSGGSLSRFLTVGPTP